MVVPVDGSRQQHALHFTLPFPVHPPYSLEPTQQETPRVPDPPLWWGAGAGRPGACIHSPFTLFLLCKPSAIPSGSLPSY